LFYDGFLMASVDPHSALICLLANCLNEINNHRWVRADYVAFLIAHSRDPIWYFPVYARKATVFGGLNHHLSTDVCITRFLLF